MAEAAGLALAVFPLCIELIKYYCAGIATLRDMREHHHLLKEFDRELNMEYCKYKTSLASVFDGTVTAATIFEDPAAAKARLEDRLPFPDVVENFIKAVERMRDEVKELQMKFEIDRDTSGKINQQVSLNSSLKV